MTREAMNYNDLEHMLHQDAEPRMINFLLLKEITNNFSEERKIGSGGFGDVYMGVLSSQIIVAVKRLFRHNAHEDRPFQKEVECLMTVRHRNIARLLGYCASYKGEMLPKDGRLVLANNHEKLLCFEYLSNGNLLNQLKDASCGPEWHTRYLMIKGICHGLNHLHERHIIHLDLKPENILLDSDMLPKIVDFGLSRLLGEESQTSTQNVIGSPGYMAPEYWRGIITFPCDIYSLGVILKEMVTGHTSSHTIENELESWALRLGTSRVNTTLEQVRLCLEIAEECVSFNPERRPVMQDIIRRLNETETLEFSTENAASTTASRPLSLGRNAIMLSTRSLTIAWGHDEKYWRWTSRPDSRFGECAELISVHYLMVSRKIAPIDLPAAATSYTAYLVYKRAGNTLEGTVQKASTLHFDNIIASSKVSLHPKEGGPSSAHGVTYPVTRGDGWLELRLGEFSNEKPVTVQLLHEDPNKEMSGLIIDGMEIRRRP